VVEGGRSAVERYALTLAIVAAATALRVALDPVWGAGLPYITFYPAVMLAAWLGGLGPGLVATALSAVIADYLWIPPPFSFAISSRPDALGLAVFLAMGALISLLNEGWYRSTRAASGAVARLDAARAETDRARQEAEQSAQQLQTALQAGRMGTWQYTIATGEVRWSPGLEAIHGYAPGTFPGTFEAFRKEIHPEDRDRVLQAISTALADQRDHHVEYRIVRPDGEVRWVEGVGQVFADAEGRPERMVGICSDVTERKDIEHTRAELLVREQAARAELERASRLKDEFLAVLSHELRTPLNAVLGYAQLLARRGLSADRTAHAVAAIQRNAQAQARLVESLLDLSRIMAGKLELNLERQDLGAIVEAAVDVIRPDADAKDITLHVERPSDPVVLMCDGERLQQVFWNLLSNAIKFTPRGGTVDVSITPNEGSAEVAISDNGQGISPEFLPYVFDRFRQAESHRSRASAGLGLGLALVREMVHAHRGSVVAQSPGEGRGSTFIVVLPLAVSTEAAVDAGPPASSPMGGDSLDGLDVLVVDDDSDGRDLLALLLESNGAAVVAVGSAAEALDAIDGRRPDLLLADLRMPGEDGYSLIRRVRAQERARGAAHLPALAVSAYATAADREQAIGAGFDGHVAKPIDPDALRTAIAEVVRSERA